MNQEDRSEVASFSIEAISLSVQSRKSDPGTSALRPPLSTPPPQCNLRHAQTSLHSISVVQPILRPDTNYSPTPYHKLLAPSPSCRKRASHRHEVLHLHLRHSHTKTETQNPTDHIPFCPSEWKDKKKHKRKRRKSAWLSHLTRAPSSFRLLLTEASQLHYPEPPFRPAQAGFLEISCPCGGAEDFTSDRHQL